MSNIRLKVSQWLAFILMVLVYLLFYGQVVAQVLSAPLRAIITKNGLPQSFVSGLLQAENGFVWVGTRNGLARYDGVHFKVFHHNKSDTASLSSNVIIFLAKDQQQNIWIEHESGEIDKLTPKTETFERITNRPLFKKNPINVTRRGWIVDANDNLWCTGNTSGLYKYDWKKQTVTHFTHKKNGLPSDTIRGFLVDSKQQLWVISQRGISVFNDKTERFSNITFPFSLDFNDYVDSEGEIIAVKERTNGELIFGDRQKLVRYNPSQNSFLFNPLPIKSKTGIRWMQTSPEGKDYFELEGALYELNDTGLTPVVQIANSSQRDVKSFLIDKSGLVWLGLNAAGILQFDLNKPFFATHENVASFHADVLRQTFGIELEKLAEWPFNAKDFIGSSYFFRSVYDSKHRLWFALRDKIGYYDSVQKKAVLLPPVPDVVNANNLSLGVRGIDFAPNGTLWTIGHDGYIGYFDTANQKWETFLSNKFLQQIDAHITLLDLRVDNEYLWISTVSNGLLSVGIHTKQVRQFSQRNYQNLLPTDILLGLLPDPTQPDLLWIGSYEGLTCLNKKTLKSEIFTTQNGLPDNTIYAMLADKAGYLWFGTNKGLCRFHPSSHQIEVFKSADGLPEEEFNRFHSLLLPNGNMAFGGAGSWVEFNPLAVKRDTFQPQVVFTELKINNQPMQAAFGKDEHPKALNGIDKLLLLYTQNTLTFDFAGLEFNQPQKLQYRYQLEGYDDNWVFAANTPVANYTRLPPGNYVFKINASNTTGQWSKYIRTLNVIIRPPFWRTWCAYLIYLVLAILLLWRYVRFKINQERLRQAVILKQREAEQLKKVEEMKSHFFSNVTHEFRTPLTLIFGPAQRLKETLKLPEQHSWLTSIERNAQQLLGLVNQLLDVSKLESGKLEVNETLNNLGEFVTAIVQSFKHEAEANQIKLIFINQQNLANYWFDADKLEHIIGNLLANAIKFTPQGESVELALFSKDTDNNLAQKGITITISDTGIGIPATQLPYIFNRFYQVYDQQKAVLKDRQLKGSGIGLSLVKELVDLKGGNIKVSSLDKENEGWKTVFTVWLPYKTAVFAEEISSDKMAIFTVNKHVSSPFVEIKTKPARASTTIHIEENIASTEPDVLTILLVEDNQDLATFIAESLPNIYQITKVVNGVDGLEKALSLVPDLIISDVLMPIMNGYEFCKKVKADDRTSHIPVIMLTAKAAFDDKIEGLTGGADDYLTKPFHVEELRLRVRNLFERQRRYRDWMRQKISQPDANEPPQLPDPIETLQNEFIKKLYAIVEDRLDDAAFGVEELASEMAMSRSNLHRKIKAIVGLPTSEVIRNYRLKRAAYFLKKGHNSSETAYMVGFDSPAYFSKCFHDFYKVTPTEFMQ